MLFEWGTTQSFASVSNPRVTAEIAPAPGAHFRIGCNNNLVNIGFARRDPKTKA